MNQDILLSKILSNSTDTAWAQSYTTINVYIALSIENEKSKHPITSYGKDLLEKLQREFFALDDKSLLHIKKAVDNVAKTIEDECEYSIIIGAIVHDVLYIVIAGKGQVIMKRGEKAGVIAEGDEKKLIGFSGKLNPDDIVIFETAGFDKKLPFFSLQEYLSSHDVSQIAENIAPLIHKNSKGTEAAIIIQYKDLTTTTNTVEEVPFTFAKEKEEPQENEHPKNQYQHENLWTKPSIVQNHGIEDMSEDINESLPNGETIEEPIKKRSFSFNRINFANKKTLIVGIIILIIIIIVGSIFFENIKKEAARQKIAFEKVYNPAKEKFNEGTALESLNKSLTLEDINISAKMVSDALLQFPKTSAEYKQLITLQSQIKSEISKIGGGSSAKNVTDFFKPTKVISNITSVTLKGGDVIIADAADKRVAIIASDGSVKKTYDLKSVSPQFISADNKFVYVLGSGGIEKIDRGNGNAIKIIKGASGIGFDAFGDNVYTLSTNDITKYVSPSYTSSSYFSNTPSFTNTPIDMTISGPIFVLEANGTIESFTKGKQDTFTVKGLSAPFSNDAKIYTDTGFGNIYIMDVKNQRVVVLNQNGEYQTQYEGSFIKNATSFAIDEKNKKGYVAGDNILYSFDL